MLVLRLWIVALGQPKSAPSRMAVGPTRPSTGTAVPVDGRVGPTAMRLGADFGWPSATIQSLSTSMRPLPPDIWAVPVILSIINPDISHRIDEPFPEPVMKFCLGVVIPLYLINPIVYFS